MRRGVLQDGLIVNIGSIAGLEPMKSTPVYAASKWGLRGWSLSNYEVCPSRRDVQLAWRSSMKFCSALSNYRSCHSLHNALDTCVASVLSGQKPVCIHTCQDHD